MVISKTQCNGCKWQGINKKVCSQCTGDSIQKPSGAREKAKTPKMTKCEAEYGMRLKAEFPGAKIIFEGISLKMSNGHRYTPDWMVIFPIKGIISVPPLLVEVKARGKNGFRQASYGRAKLAYDQCRQEFDCFQWRWAEKYTGEWSK